jgi:hypothetical protein
VGGGGSIGYCDIVEFLLFGDFELCVDVSD